MNPSSDQMGNLPLIKPVTLNSQFIGITGNRKICETTPPRVNSKSKLREILQDERPSLFNNSKNIMDPKRHKRNNHYITMYGLDFGCD